MANEGGTRIVGVIGKEKSFLCAQISQQKKDALRLLAETRGCSVDVILREEITQFLKTQIVKMDEIFPEPFEGQVSDRRRITICCPKPLAKSFRDAIKYNMSSAHALRLIIDKALSSTQTA